MLGLKGVPVSATQAPKGATQLLRAVAARAHQIGGRLGSVCPLDAAGADVLQRGSRALATRNDERDQQHVVGLPDVEEV